ncbi:hypothetical protein [Eubacterium sp.]|uniref:hypothetical protein n=1 Tax=Eubacterium sp. TaxID=142586 RepID=UPI0025F55A57|nr:hypothetical protein [Eubacterium sp.]MCR5628942.1 hypothetical protein [Eubacterium sp.]
MHKVSFPTFDNEVEKTIKEINRVKNQIDNSLKRMINKEDFNMPVLFDNIRAVLERWTGHTYVGIKKEKNIKNAYQYFFESLYRLLLTYKECEYEKLQEIARMCLYQGKVYRYLGYGNALECSDKVIDPCYEDVFVSWSKSEPNGYLKSKLYGTITVLECMISGDKYGIDLDPFGVVRADEAEVVFPTIEESIIDIKYIRR